MHAYIVLSLSPDPPTEEARALHWGPTFNLDGDPAATPPVPPHIRRLADQYARTATPRPNDPAATLALPQPRSRHCTPGGQPGQRAARRRRRLARHRTGLHHPPRRRPRRGQRPQECFKRICTEAGIGDAWTTARAGDLLRQPDEPHGVSIEEIRPPRRTRHHPHHRNRLPPRTTTLITTGAEIMDQLFTGT